MKRDIIRKIQDYRWIKWNAFSGSSGTQGSLRKAVIGKNFYKLSSFNAHDGFYGHESVNELIVSRLLDILHVPHTGYRLVHALVEVDGQKDATWLCVSKDYRKSGETNVSLDIFHDLMREGRELSLDKVVHMRRQNHPAAYLRYDPVSQEFSLRIRRDAKLLDLPGMMRLFAQKGLYEPGTEWSQRWVQERIIPLDRHGIGIALRENGMKRYDECAILEKVKESRRWMICWFCLVKGRRRGQSR